MPIKDLWIPTLNNLYTITEMDWSLFIQVDLTEPTCPTISIQPEGWEITRYRSDRDSVEEGIAYVVNLVKQEIIDRKVVGSECPFSSIHDAIFEKWLLERAAGSDAKMPNLPDAD